MTPSRNKHGHSGFERLADLCHPLPTGSNEELFAGIPSQCSPALIQAGNFPNGGNQVAMLGLVIAEAGRKRLEKAAALTTEYCAWSVDDDFWVHLVPRALLALKNIGAVSVIP
jgi:hypothetical protein